MIQRFHCNREHGAHCIDRFDKSVASPCVTAIGQARSMCPRGPYQIGHLGIATSFTHAGADVVSSRIDDIRFCRARATRIPSTNRQARQADRVVLIGFWRMSICLNHSADNFDAGAATHLNGFGCSQITTTGLRNGQDSKMIRRKTAHLTDTIVLL